MILGKIKMEKMADDIDKIANKLQKNVLNGYSEKFKNEFLNPKNIGKIINPDSRANITGICGDTVEMYLAVKDGKIYDIKFVTDGCGATIACASFVTRTVKGKTLEQAFRIKPQDIDDFFEGLPEESKHCTKLSTDALKAVLNNYKNKKQILKVPSVNGKKKDKNG